MAFLRQVAVAVAFLRRVAVAFLRRVVVAFLRRVVVAVAFLRRVAEVGVLRSCGLLDGQYLRK